jgi:acyl carrier protein
MRNQIIKKVRNFITDTFFFGEQLCQYTNSESLLGKGVLDSTGILELIAYIEEEYEITVEDEEMLPDNLDTLDNIAEFVIRKQESRAGLVAGM